MSDKKYKTEFAFSFDEIGKKIKDTVNSLVNMDDVEIKQASFNANLDEATTAQVKLDLGVSELSVSALPTDSDQLITAEMQYVGEVTFETSGDTEKTVHLAQKRGAHDIVGSIKRTMKSMSQRQDLHANIALSPNIPLKLDIDAGIAPSTLDLSQLQLTGLDLDCGVGTLYLNLPESHDNYHVSVDSGVGSTRVNVPANTNLNLDINGGVGSVSLNLPENVAARLTVNGGIGGVKVTDHFENVQKQGDFLSKGGIWETAGFAVAEKQVFVNFKGGVGQFSVSVGSELEPEEKPKAKRKRKSKVQVPITHSDSDESPDINA